MLMQGVRADCCVLGRVRAVRVWIVRRRRRWLRDRRVRPAAVDADVDDGGWVLALWLGIVGGLLGEPPGKEDTVRARAFARPGVPARALHACARVSN